jgi:DNA-binding NtrC family response regulator
LAAKAIHSQSNRSAGPFIVMNAAAIPSSLIESELFGHEKGAFTGAERRHLGCFEMANNGTLFLDEIAEMPIGLQAKLLRVLEDQHVRRLGASQELVLNVRVLAATNRDSDLAISEGELRGDLYHRLNVFGLKLPALRNRKDDLDLLIKHFLTEFNERYGTRILGLQEDAMAKMQAYSWPGNVRELENVVYEAMVMTEGEWLTEAALPVRLRIAAVPVEGDPAAPACGPLKEAVQSVVGARENALILEALRQAGGNRTRAARILGISRKTLFNKMTALGIRWPE